MPFLLVAIGLVLIVTGVRDTYAQLAAQLQKDFTGQQNFTVWILAIGAVGALGYINSLRTFSHYFLALIIISMVISNKGFFQRFSQQFAAGPQTINATGVAPAPSSTNQPAAGTVNNSYFGGLITTQQSKEAATNGYFSTMFGKIINPQCWLGNC